MSGDSNVFLRRQSGSTASRASHRFLRHATSPEPRYQTDEANLIPVPTKKGGSVAVGLADAATVAIRSVKEGTRTYAATERPALRFRGSLTVEAFETNGEGATDTDSSEDEAEDRDTDSVEIDQVENVNQPGGVLDLPVIHRRGRGSLHGTVTPKHKAAVGAVHSSGVLAITRPKRLNRNPASDTLIVNAPRGASRFQSTAVLLLVLLFVSGLAVALLGGSASVVVEGDTVIETYHFSTRHVWETLRSHLPALLVNSL